MITGQRILVLLKFNIKMAISQSELHFKSTWNCSVDFTTCTGTRKKPLQIRNCLQPMTCVSPLCYCIFDKYCKQTAMLLMNFKDHCFQNVTLAVLLPSYHDKRGCCINIHVPLPQLMYIPLWISNTASKQGGWLHTWKKNKFAVSYAIKW